MMSEELRSRLGRMRRLRPSIPRLIAVALCGALVSLAVSAGAAGPACACSCRGFTTEEAASNADGVFLARATGKASSGSDDIYEFAVAEVFKGEVDAVTVVGTAHDGPSCGVKFELGRDYLLFVDAGLSEGVGRGWESNLCTGPATLSPSDVRGVLERDFGPPRPPNPAPPTQMLDATDGVLAKSSWWTRVTATVPLPLLVVTGGLVLAAVGWIVVHRRRRGTRP